MRCGAESVVMRYVVFGAGAIGGVVGGRLAEAGLEVALIARGAHLEAIRRDGLTVRSPDGSVTLDVPAYADPVAAGVGEGDVILLAVKGQQTPAALAALAGAPSSTPVACLQNGVANEREVLRRFTNVYGVAVMLPATHVSPGVVDASSSPTTGILDLGRYPRGVDETAEAIASAFRSATFSSEATPDIMRWKHAKLLMNLGNAIQALCGLQGRGGSLWPMAKAEGVACLAAAGIEVASEEEDLARRGEHLSVRPIDGERRGGSTWQSLVRGAPDVETDLLNGEIVLLGRLHGIPTPVNESLQRLMHQATREAWQPGVMTEDEILALV